MYFPYLRGRQNELLALRELIAGGFLSQNIIPVIEPVKLSPTLSKTLESFVVSKREIAFICNPAVGSFGNDMKTTESDKNKEKILELVKDRYIIKSNIINKRSEKSISSWEQKRGVTKEAWLTILTNRDMLSAYEDVFSTTPPRFVLMPDESTFRRKIKQNRVLFDDKFEKEERNSAYVSEPDQFFSEDHLYYQNDGYIGFGDYSIIGSDYLESGFAPYAVAIHIVYFAPDHSLRVHHFVSDSNEDIQNPAKKFYEAVSKLASWYETNPFPLTLGLNTLLEHYRQQTYPGLGSIKKLSLMHHLELMGKFLDGEV